MKTLKAMMMTLIMAVVSISTTIPLSAQTRGDFLVANDTLIEARLNQRLRAERIQRGTRFTLTVQAPRQFRGAVIEGYVEGAQRSGRVSGSSEIVLNFDRIRHRGRTYAFSGTIEGVRTSRGERVEIDREGAVRDDSQTDRTVERGVGGAIVGTIIGAIAGGGSGAAKGALIGGGLGVGSVLVQGRNNLDLRDGTRFTLRAHAPRY